MKPLKQIIFIGICGMFGYFIIDAVQHIQSEIHHRNGFIKKERGLPYQEHFLPTYKAFTSELIKVNT